MNNNLLQFWLKNLRRNSAYSSLDTIDGTELVMIGKASGSETVGRATLSQVGLQGGTAGLVTASLPVVPDSNKDIGDFRNVDVVNLDAGASGTAGSVDIFPTTALKGKIARTATANTNDDIITITNAAFGQASTLTIPDPGGATASFVMTEGAATINGVKTFGSAPLLPALAVAAAGTNAATATVLTASFNAVTGADGVKGVALPAAVTSSEIEVINTNSVFPLLVYPVSGGNDFINELAEDLPITLAPREAMTFIATSGTQWYARNPVGFGRSDKQVFFEDFLGTWAIGDAGPADLFSTTAGNGTSNQVATTVAASLGGTITLKSASDDGAITANMTNMTMIGLAYKANQGGLAFETRLKVDAITDLYLFVGFTDTISTTLEEPIFLTAADIDSTATDACGILFDTDGTTSDLWLHGGVANDVDTVPAYASVAPTAPVADTFVTLRVEVSAAGAVRGFINGTPIGAAVAAAVTATIALTPAIFVANRGAAQRIVTVDTWKVEQNR